MQHASFWRGKGQSSQEHVISRLVYADASTSEVHASPPSSFRMRHVSPSEAPETPQAPREFGGDPSDLSLLPLYTDHVAKHV